MDWLDFIWKFSGELVILAITVTVALSNIYFFADIHSYNDQSYAAVFLNNHYAFNQKLYERNNRIITTVAQNNPLVSEAKAEDFAGLTDTSAGDASPGDETDYLINQDGIVKPNPDSIQSLIQKQIKIYQTKSGDSLKSIAAQNGISADTIKWANKLTSDQISPGWQLLILPVDGVLYKADSNTTLPDMVKKFSADSSKIMSYNLMESEEDINPGQLYIIPGGSMPAPPPPKPKPAKPKKGEVQQPKNIDYGSGHLFPWGYCTYYVASKINIPWGGNAKQWLANAKAYGRTVTTQASAGSIVVTNDSRRFGHVAIVEQVEGDQFLVSEMNYKGKGVIDQRWIPINSSSVKGFIHP